MRLMTIPSGSSGNCIYTGDNHTHILIDAGISKKRIEDGLKGADINPNDISGIFITHEHSDHISGLGVMSRKYNIPIYATKRTIEEIKNIPTLGKFDFELFNEVEPDKSVDIGSLSVNPFSISHDAAEPVGYRVQSGEKKIAVATDMGTYND